MDKLSLAPNRVSTRSFCARGHAQSAPEQDLRDEAPTAIPTRTPRLSWWVDLARRAGTSRYGRAHRSRWDGTEGRGMRHGRHSRIPSAASLLMVERSVSPDSPKGFPARGCGRIRPPVAACRILIALDAFHGNPPIFLPSIIPIWSMFKPLTLGTLANPDPQSLLGTQKARHQQKTIQAGPPKTGGLYS